MPNHLINENSPYLLQQARFSTLDTSDIVCNADIRGAEIRQLNLTARAYYRILKLSRMIEDLAGSDENQKE